MRKCVFLICFCLVLGYLAYQLLFRQSVFALKPDDSKQSLLPTGKRITPLATRGAHLESLNPELPDFPHYLAGQAMTTLVDGEGKTLFVLTTGFNRIKNDADKNIEDASNEYVFVYDISGATPRKTQVLKVPNTFAGMALALDGKHFYIAGGKDDNLHVFRKGANGIWAEDGDPIQLGHTMGGLSLIHI